MKYYFTCEMSGAVGSRVETLRYYENKGILYPKRDESNNYRLYSLDDIRRFDSCRIFQSFGFTIEESGIQINTKSEVLNVEGNVIPGLYAAGEVTGGIHGAKCLGGNALADINTFGRIAGKNAALAE